MLEVLVLPIMTHGYEYRIAIISIIAILLFAIYGLVLSITALVDVIMTRDLLLMSSRNQVLLLLTDRDIGLYATRSLVFSLFALIGLAGVIIYGTSVVYRFHTPEQILIAQTIFITLAIIEFIMLYNAHSDLSVRSRIERSVQDYRIALDRKSYEMFESLLDTALDPAMITDQRGTITHWNKAAVSIFGYEKKTAVGRNIIDLIVVPEQRSTLLSMVNRFLEDGYSEYLGRTLHVKVCNSRGEVMPADVRVEEIKNTPEPRFNVYMHVISVVS